MSSGNDRSSGSRGSTGRGGRPGGGAGKSGGRSSGGKGGGSGSRSSDRSSASRDGGKPGGRTSGGAPRKYGADKPKRGDDELEPIPGNQQWGGLARKGVLRANQDEQRDYEDAAERRRRDDDLEPDERAKREAREQRRVARDQRQAQLRAEAKAAVQRSGVDKPKAKRARRATPALERAVLPDRPATAGDAYAVLAKMFGAADAKKHMRKVNSAADAYEAERFADAARQLKFMIELAPGIADVRELNGLILYRQGKYRLAAKELEEFRVLGASTEQNPVLMDCYRAVKRWADVDELWEELSEVSPSAPLVNEGRIVMANALADNGGLAEAVALLEKGWKRPSRPHDHHLRRAYALADLYERSGDLPRARALFDWLVKKDPNFVDAGTRLRSLR